MDYEIIIGLEIHVQLQTESKMFSWSGTDFGLPPNTQTDPVSLGLPGTLPVMNRKAFELALKTAVGLGAEIAPFTKWDRKNYYYPDLPKNYQISQYDLPFSRGGHLEIPVRKDGGGGGRCRLTRIHLEEDTGKLTHGDGGFSEVDLNRAGIPLLEIVTEPDIRSPADARGCLEELRLTLRYLEVSDCEMQEGSLRCDANVNLHITKDGADDRHADRRDQEPEQLPGRREGPALRSRAAVQEVACRTALTIKDAPKTTRGWNDVDEVTKPQREKESARRLSLFSRARLGSRRGRLGLARPHPSFDRRAAGGSAAAVRVEYGLSAYDANVLVEQGQDVADYFDAVAAATERIQAGEQLDSAGRAQDDQGEEADRRPIFRFGRRELAELINRVKRRRAEYQPGPRSPGPDDRDRRTGRGDHRQRGLPDGLRPRRDRRGC